MLKLWRGLSEDARHMLGYMLILIVFFVVVAMLLGPQLTTIFYNGPDNL